MVSTNSWLSKFAQTTQLSDVFAYRRGTEHQSATYKRGNSRIDYMLATADVLPFILSCGYLDFDSTSDHRMMFTDIDLIAYLQDTPPSLSAQHQPRAILSRHEKMSRLYKEEVMRQLHAAHYSQRTNLLSSKITLQNNQMRDEDRTEIKSINTLITKAMLSSEAKFTCTHATPWSPTLMVFVHTLEYWKAWISEICTGTNLNHSRQYRLNETEKTGATIEAATMDPPSLADANCHRNRSRRQLRKANKKAHELREQWLLKKEDQAAGTGDKARQRMLRTI